MSDEHGGNTLWHGRFEGGPDAALMAYTVSLPFDRRLWADDIAGSRAHVRGLARVGLITDAERDAVLQALDQVSTTRSPPGASNSSSPTRTSTPPSSVA